MAEKIRVVHYLNQFFAQVGGEEKGGIGPGFKPGPIGPGRALQQALAEYGEVVATFFCGDNYFAEHPEEATDELLRQMASVESPAADRGPCLRKRALWRRVRRHLPSGPGAPRYSGRGRHEQRERGNSALPQARVYYRFRFLGGAHGAGPPADGCPRT